MKNQERLTFLAEQVMNGTASANECQELIELINKADAEDIEKITAFNNARISSSRTPDFNSSYWKDGIKEVLVACKTTSARPQTRVHFLKTAWFRYAAILLLIAGSAGFFFYKTPEKPAAITYNPAEIQEIAPGKDGAILTLADGTEMLLDSLGNGVVTTQTGARIVFNDGLLRYEADGTKSEEPMYNTIHTPKGRQFKLTLSDGTKVWLNSDSQIAYPIVFGNNNRNVRIEGEVYFEVEQNRKSPFVVNVRDRMNVEVLGTHFNINAYNKEQVIKTTLLEGSVKVHADMSDNASKKTVILQPGQQARLADKETTGIQTSVADINKVIAWKNGLFNFEDANLQEVMNQLERWYDLEVVYEKGIPDMTFVGKMSRGMQLPNLLKALEQSGVHFRLEEGRKLVVMPQ